MFAGFTFPRSLDNVNNKNQNLGLSFFHFVIHSFSPFSGSWIVKTVNTKASDNKGCLYSFFLLHTFNSPLLLSYILILFKPVQSSGSVRRRVWRHQDLRGHEVRLLSRRCDSSQRHSLCRMPGYELWSDPVSYIAGVLGLLLRSKNDVTKFSVFFVPLVTFLQLGLCIVET